MKEIHYHLGMIGIIVMMIIVRVILAYFNIAWMKTVNMYDILIAALLFFNSGVLFARNIN